MNIFSVKFRLHIVFAVLVFTVSLTASPLPMAFRLPSNDLYRYDLLSGSQERTVIVFESPVPCGTGCPSMPVSLQPGCRYSFSALVNADISGGVVQLMLEWRDAKGRRLGSAYGNPLNDNEVLPPGWLRYGGMTAAIPPETCSAAMFFYVSSGAKGKAIFDAFDLTEFDAYSVGPLLCSEYQNVSTGGTARFVVPLHGFNDLKLPASSFDAIFSYSGNGGAERQVRASRMDLDSAEVVLDVSEMACGTNAVSFTLHSKGKCYGKASVDFAKVTHLPKRSVWIDRKNRLIVDGKPFFMLGMYWRCITPVELDAFCPSPFNTVLPCQRPVRAQFDMCAERGLKMCYPFEHRYDVPGENTNVVRIVNALKDHPALLLWYLNDERPVSMVKQVTARHDVVRSLDGNHPTWTMCDHPEKVKSFLGSYEIIGADSYPIGNALPGYPYPLENVLKYARMARKGSYGLYPLWHVPQAFSWGWFRKGRTDHIDMRYPAREEIRQMTWQYLAAGANGIIYYAFNALRDNFKGAEFDRKWTELKEIAAEVKSFENVFLTDEDAPSVTGMTESVGARAWRYRGEVWLLAVNATRSPQKALLKLDCAVSGSIKPVFGTPPTRKSSSCFEYSLSPMECTFVRLPPGESKIQCFE